MISGGSLNDSRPFSRQAPLPLGDAATEVGLTTVDTPPRRGPQSSEHLKEANLCLTAARERLTSAFDTKEVLLPAPVADAPRQGSFTFRKERHT